MLYRPTVSAADFRLITLAEVLLAQENQQVRVPFHCALELTAAQAHIPQELAFLKLFPITPVDCRVADSQDGLHLLDCATDHGELLNLFRTYGFNRARHDCSMTFLDPHFHNVLHSRDGALFPGIMGIFAHGPDGGFSCEFFPARNDDVAIFRGEFEGKTGATELLTREKKRA